MAHDFENTRLNTLHLHKVRQVVNDLLSCPAPLREMQRLVKMAKSPHASAFEQYAGSLLKEPLEQLAQSVPPGQSVRLFPPTGHHLVRLGLTGEPEGAASRALDAAEDCLNRLLCIADTLEDAPLGERAEGQRGIAISQFGRSYTQVRRGYRSALVKLPAIGFSEQPTVSYFNEVDWRILDHIASNAHTVFQGCIKPNLCQSVLGAYAPDGSDWDIRTRLASILSGLELPLKSRFRFDCDAARHAVSVRFTAPEADRFPAVGEGVEAKPAGKQANRGLLEAARTSYLLRLACLMAAACYGSGKHVEHAIVVAEDPATGKPVLHARFTRDRFVRTALVAIDQGELAASRLRFQPDELVGLACPDLVELAGSSESGALPKPDDGMSQQRVEPWKDTRPLPDDMARLFHAKRICDIDTTHYHGKHAALIDEAKHDAADSSIAAIARLEDIVSELDAETAPPDDDASARPLYCDQPLSRAVVSLLDDHFAVAGQAEAFLGASAEGAQPTEGPEYFRAPSALFHARIGLSDLYERLGDYRGAEEQANRCIDLAPTTAQAHFRKADLLAQQGRDVEAINVILAALPVTVSERDCALLYYHLALLLWRIGRKREAASVYVYTASLVGEFAQKASQTVVGLRKRDGIPVIVYASPIAAAREMESLRIPVSPNDSARALVVRAAIGLACAGAPEAAAPYAAALARYLRDDPVVGIACESIRFGTAHSL